MGAAGLWHCSGVDVGCCGCPQGAQADPLPCPSPWCLRVTHILNVAREIDNFFPALFTYMNVRVYDEETAQLLPHWNDTFLFLSHVRSVGPGQPWGTGAMWGLQDVGHRGRGVGARSRMKGIQHGWRYLGRYLGD